VAFINQSIDDPATREAVTPQYPWGCKRVVRASNFYEALNRPNVELVPHEVTQVTPTGIVDATGTERHAQRRWTAWVDRRLATTASAMESGCHNYYHAAGGANVTQWPGTPIGYAAATRLFARFGLEGRR
jgi:cation diffusion facilitator CzcD-associated flavoprotein CzcO